MAKTYPVVLYPRLITKFLAEHPLPSAKKNVQVDPQRKLEKAAFPQPQGELFFLGWIVCSGVLVVCLYFLSPGWLAALAWLAMGSGYLATQKSLISQKSKVKRPNDLVSLASTLPSPRSWSREQQLRQLLEGKVLAPARVSKAQKGVSEERFLAQLKAIFPDIKQGLEFDNPEFSVPYAADFVFIHDCGVSLDIEVDEPYVGDTRQPHHATDQGKDDLRNHFFRRKDKEAVTNGKVAETFS
jgi:hypothetical protein